MADHFLTAEKSCGPQLCLEEMPSSAWTLDDLGRYAQTRHAVVVADEKHLTPLYWQLGMALNLARKLAPYGTWNAFLTTWGIEKTRASKARAIFRTFASPQQVSGLSIEEAYAQRARSSRVKRQSDSHPGITVTLLPLHELLFHVQQQRDKISDEVAFLSAREAQETLQSLRTLNDEMLRLQRQLQQKLGNEVTA